MTNDRRTKALDSLHGLALGDALVPSSSSPPTTTSSSSKTFRPVHGNGAMMPRWRVAPLGAWLADDLAEEAASSAEVTHAHPEGVAGAVAVAWLQRSRPGRHRLNRRTSWTRCWSTCRAGAYTRGSARPGAWPTCRPPSSRRTSWATVATRVLATPCPSRSGLPRATSPTTSRPSGRRPLRGDVDTTCAIVGGIVAAHVGLDGLPERWRAVCEPLPDWAETT